MVTVWDEFVLTSGMGAAAKAIATTTIPKVIPSLFKSGHRLPTHYSNVPEPINYKDKANRSLS